MAKPIYETAIKPYLENIREWYAAGETKKQIAKRLHVADSTFRKYIAEEPAFAAVFARELPNMEETVKNAMLKRAQGYRYKEYVTEITRDGDGKILSEKTKEYERECPPDPTSAKFWWEVNHRGENADAEGGVIILPEVQSE